MSAWSNDRGGPLTREDIEEMLKFIRESWSKGPRKALDEHALAGDLARAENSFARECFQCHGVKGVGGPNLHIGKSATALDREQRLLARSDQERTPRHALPSFSAKLGAAGNRRPDSAAAQLGIASTSASSPARPPPHPTRAGPPESKGPEPVGFKVQPLDHSVDVVHAELQRGARMALLDARTPSDYMNEHIAGAVSVPFYDPTEYLAELPKSAWLVC